jgi:Cytochrome P460
MKHRPAILMAVVVAAVAVFSIGKSAQNKKVFAAQKASDTTASAPSTTAQYTADGKLKLPVGFRRWIFIGAPTTPNALNDGEANFPEFHHVYVEEKNLDVYLKTGTFPEGTTLVKELARSQPDLSRRLANRAFRKRFLQR